MTKKALQSGLISGLIGLFISGLLNYTIIPFPENLFMNALGNGISGFMSGFMGGFMAIKMLKNKNEE